MAGSRPTTSRRLPHLAALDGWRGVAVLAVLLFHGGVSWARGGFLGVDAFFVLSGFLITALALFEVDGSGSLDLRAFWSRRARRLLPALLITLGGICAYAAWIAPTDTLRAIRGDALATLGYVANWRYLATSTGYFAQSSVPSPLLHTWSLAIEEQFYLLFPIILLLAARWRRARPLAVAIVAGTLALASGVEMALLASNPDRVYFGTDTRAQSLLIGVACGAVYVHLATRVGRRRPVPFALNYVSAVLALVFAIALCARLDGTSSALYHGGLFAFSIAVGWAVLHMARYPTTRLARSLSWQPLTSLGRISYGVYLFHWPLFLVLTHERTGLSGLALLGTRVAVTIAAATASFVLIERRVVEGRLPRWRWPIVQPVTAMATVAAGLFVVTVAAAPASFTAPTVTPAAAATPTTAVPLPAPHVVPLDQPVRVMVVGDSVGMTLGDGMAPVAGKSGVDLVNRARLGCGIARGTPYHYFGKDEDEPPECESWPAEWAADVADVNPDVVLVVVGRWEVMDRIHDGTWMRIGDRPYDEYLRTEIDTAARVLSSRGAVVVFATAPYYRRGEQPNGDLYPEDEPARVDQWNALLRETVARTTAAATVDLGGLLSPQGKLAFTIDGVTVRQGDGVHITPQGGRWLAPQLLPALTALVSRSPAVATTTPPPSSSPPG